MADGRREKEGRVGQVGRQDSRARRGMYEEDLNLHADQGRGSKRKRPAGCSNAQIPWMFRFISEVLLEMEHGGLAMVTAWDRWQG